jgi:hypothetical protein
MHFALKNMYGELEIYSSKFLFFLLKFVLCGKLRFKLCEEK